MLNKLLELKDSLEQNWTYLHKVLFTFSFYLLYKAFLKVLDSETMSPYILIFIVIGFFIFTIDILIYPFIDLFNRKKLKYLDKKRRIANITVYFFISLSILSTIYYYLTHYYPVVNIVIFSLIMSVFSYSFILDYYQNKKAKIIKWAIAILTIIGFAGIIHGFYLNKTLNVNTFTLIFVFGFFIVDFLIYKWRAK